MNTRAKLTFVLADLLPAAIRPTHGRAVTLIRCSVQSINSLSRITKPPLAAWAFSLLPFGVEGADAVEFAHGTVLSLISCYFT
jgi:hypothetical protein